MSIRGRGLEPVRASAVVGWDVNLRLTKIELALLDVRRRQQGVALALLLSNLLVLATLLSIWGIAWSL